MVRLSDIIKGYHKVVDQVALLKCFRKTSKEVWFDLKEWMNGLDLETNGLYLCANKL